MIVGETIRLRHVETQADAVTGLPAAFTATAPTVLVTAPDGSASSAAVRVDLGSASDPASLALVLSFLVTPATGGAYTCTLTYQDADGETITRLLTAFATWTDPAPLVQNRLQTALLPEVFEPEFASAARKLLSQFVCIGNPAGSTPAVGLYSGLAGDDRAYFDEAVSLAVCARLVGPLRNEGFSSDVVKRKIDDYELSFADQTRERVEERGSPGDYGAGPGGYSGTNERVRWLRESAETLGKIACIAQYSQAQRAAFSPFVITGLTRQQNKNSQAAGGGRTLLGQVVDLFTGDYFAEQGERSFGGPGCS